MKKIALFFIFAAMVALCGCGRDGLGMTPTSDSTSDARDVEYVPTLGETAIVAAESDDSGYVRDYVELWPKEIYFGDPIYIAAFIENASSETMRYVPAFLDIPDYDRGGSPIAISSTEIEGEYKWRPSRPPWIKWIACYTGSYKELAPGAKRPTGKFCLELPSLSAMDDPFWKSLNEKLTPEGIKVQVKICVEFSDASNIRRPRTLTQEIVIKPRPKGETALLEKWRKETSRPKAEGDSNALRSDYPNELDLQARGPGDVKIGGKKYNPWLFIRYENRKPSIPNNPTTLEGWRELEASLVPSSMRDEVRLTRLQLEYYAAPQGEATERAKERLLEWIKSLPEVQQTVMISSLCDYNRTQLAKTPFNEKWRDFRTALQQGVGENGCLR